MVFGKKKKGKDVRELTAKIEEKDNEETPDLEIDVEEENLIKEIKESVESDLPEIEEDSDDDEIEKIKSQLAEAEKRRDEKLIEEKLEDSQMSLKILKGELTDEGFLYVIQTNKSLGEIGEVLHY